MELSEKNMNVIKEITDHAESILKILNEHLQTREGRFAFNKIEEALMWAQSGFLRKAQVESAKEEGKE